MKLPSATKGVVAISVAAGLAIFTVAAIMVLDRPLADAYQLATFATITVLIGAMWLWPLVMYRDGQSEALTVDEGFFILLALLVPAALGVLAFGIAVAVAQVPRRRQAVKSVFNFGQVVVSAGTGFAVTRLLAPATPRLTIAQLAAAAAGAAVYSVVNNGSMAAIMATLGTSWRRSTLDGFGIRVRLLGSCVAVATITALAVSAYRWSLPLAVLPLVVLRQVLAGHLQARHDRARLLGLFDAALEANRSLGEGEVAAAVLGSARDLLRCPEARVSAEPPGHAELGAPMLVNGQSSWLVVSGRSRTEPFDAADTALLEALGAVGAGALTNGEHYREGRFQRERLAAITSSLGEGVCALDQSARVTFMNPAAARMLGLEAPSGSVALTAGDDQGDGPATPEFLSVSAREVMQSRETVRSDDADFRRPDGTALPVAFTASAILDDERVAGAVIVFRDISQRREMENAIREARDQAIEASRLKSQFLANMSHEIRTPMNGVLCMSRLLLETQLDQMQHQCLEVIRDSGENLMVIINDILDFSKIEAGKLELEEVDFELGDLLGSVTNAMTVPAHDKGLVLRLDLGPDLPGRVRGDPVRLRQILINLVGNAIKFTHFGAVVVTAGSPRPGRVRIAVRDTGIGIDPTARATVLDAFGQADSSTTRRYGGTGLGLAICSQLVGMMGGALDFASQPGEGSTFWFEVPLEEARPAPTASPSRRNRPASIGAAAARPDGAAVLSARLRVLLADDSAVNQLVATLELERLGCEVDVVASGGEAVRAVQRGHYDAVLMDCLMPGMDGYEATRRIRRLDVPAAATPIIAMTASALVGDREGCLGAGMDDYLSKPLDANLLATALTRVSQGAYFRPLDPIDVAKGVGTTDREHAGGTGVSR